jgi:Zn finger protein HypA/HybF involved in hydrogenase expression
MDNVVSLASRRKDPHSSGQAKCIACGHEFKAVVPVGILFFECPKCTLSKATFVGMCEMPEGTEVFTCLHCDGQLFELVLDQGAFCRGCGVIHSWEDVAKANG